MRVDKSTIRAFCIPILIIWLGGCTQSPTQTPTPTTECSFNIPEPPDPLPANFEWRPLAVDWCDQLEACGYILQDCVDIYLKIINNPPTGPTTPITPSGTVTDSTAIELDCQDSKEFLNGDIDCP